MVGSVECFHQIDEGDMGRKAMVPPSSQQCFQSEDSFSATNARCRSELESRAMTIQNHEQSLVQNLTENLGYNIHVNLCNCLPNGTYTSRATVKETLVEDSIWTVDQIQGVVNVNVPVGMVVVKVRECEFKRLI